jgi:hypothetical protein
MLGPRKGEVVQEEICERIIQAEIVSLEYVMHFSKSRALCQFTRDSRAHKQEAYSVRGGILILRTRGIRARRQRAKEHIQWVS